MNIYQYNINKRQEARRAQLKEYIAVVIAFPMFWLLFVLLSAMQ